MNGFVTTAALAPEAEAFIAAGIPLVASIIGTLKGLRLRKDRRHLLVISGFEADGDSLSTTRVRLGKLP